MDGQASSRAEEVRGMVAVVVDQDVAVVVAVVVVDAREHPGWDWEAICVFLMFEQGRSTDLHVLDHRANGGRLGQGSPKTSAVGAVGADR